VAVHAVAWLGFFYGGIIAGAVLGCLLAGFYLLRLNDIGNATAVAASINGVVALTGLVLAEVTTSAAPPKSPAENRNERIAGSWAESLPYWPINPPLPPGPWQLFQLPSEGIRRWLALGPKNPVAE
jgi:hypothetical protein